MQSVTPRVIVEAIDDMFPPMQVDLDSRRIDHRWHVQVRALLGLLEQLPKEFVTLASRDYVEFERCRAALATAIPAWSLHGTYPVPDVGGKDAVERIRRLMMICPDALPPPQPEFPFVKNEDLRFEIEDRVRAAWIDFGANEWLGATTFAAVALETVLLWEVKQSIRFERQNAAVKTKKKSPDEMLLGELVEAAVATGSISDDAAKLAQLARDARNLLHPGKAARTGWRCNKATALTAFAALYQVANELSRKSES